ncbi:MAG TPA: GNAT family N-acetyltransferase [Porticoccaceae bacterium]|nr:GNAT family N-acetyltransferase [Porticoccaceae bacterium]
MANYPFLETQFLDILAASQSVGPDTGWHARHIAIGDADRPTAFMPTYLKDHSWGEYVFDWAWADAYHRHGLSYYPKLVSAIPFTPVSGPRVRYATDANRQTLARALIDAAIEQVEEFGASGWHLLFPDEQTLTDFSDERLLRREGVQFHWRNRNYESFQHFLDQFVSRKRKMVRRERRRILEQDIQIKLLEGSEIGTELWDFFYRLYQTTYLKRSGNRGYLTAEFFQMLGSRMPDQVVMALASESEQPVACALYLRDDDTLFGRYWGCIKEYDCLHFELCYYQGIEYAIERGLSRFDAGAQGEHKILRGFEPVTTYSLHWLAHLGFTGAIDQFLTQERADNQRYIESARSVLPYRQEINDTVDATTSR